MPSCAQIVLDTADIVRDGDVSTVRVAPIVAFRFGKGGLVV